MKKGQIDISFSMIFSVILIVLIIGVAFYAISFFLNLSECNKIAFFYNDLKEETQKAVKSAGYRDEFKKILPEKIEWVCFGDLKAESDRKYDEIKEELRRYSNLDKNVFVYPSRKACDNNLAYYKIEDVKIEGFFCVENEQGEVVFSIEKESSDKEVEILNE